MILDSIKNAELYYGISPRMKQAFDYLNSTDLASLAEGVHKIDGDNLFINVVERGLKAKEDAKLEVHNRYADIQVLISGEGEGFGWSDRQELTQPQSEFNEEKDIQFFDDVPQTYYTIKPGQFTILMPEDGHAPLVGSCHVKKAIVKVLL